MRASAEKVRCAVVGCGSIAQVHGQVLHEMEDVEITAFADCILSRAQEMAEKFGGQAYASLEELLEKERPQVVHLCTPHYMHTPMAKICAERGVHVFTEKPPVISREQWAEFAALQDKVRVGVCFQNRYNRSVRLFHELLQSGRPGRLLGARAFVTWRRDAPYYTESGWRGSLATEGGGALINQSIHTLDLLVQFFGRAAGVEASMANRHLQGIIEVEDTLEATIDFGGRRAIFYATTAHCTNSPVLLELVCENCTMRMEEENVSLYWADGGTEHRTLPPADRARGKSYWGNSHGLCIRDFYRCLREEREFGNDIPGVRDTVELMLDVYDSARRRRPEKSPRPGERSTHAGDTGAGAGEAAHMV